MSLSEQIRKKRQPSIMQRAARKYGVSYDYVRMIASGRRKGFRGKGLLIKRWLERQIQEHHTKTNV